MPLYRVEKGLGFYHDDPGKDDEYLYEVVAEMSLDSFSHLFIQHKLTESPICAFMVLVSVSRAISKISTNLAF